jgi:Protein of unknown function (DUF3306)
MSDREGFLTRWSRRKREAGEHFDKRPADDADHAPTQAGDASTANVAATTDAGAAATGVAATGVAKAKAAAVDLDSLPSIESITSATDIRAFLAPGIPPQLARAALRRAWVADPAIRDFVGLSENAWDFNAPDTVPGFGSSIPAADVRRMMANLLSEDPQGSEDATPIEGESSTEPEVSPPASARPVPPDTQPVPVAASDAEVVDEESPPPDAVGDDAAMQKETADLRPVRSGPRHGGALPQ